MDTNTNKMSTDFKLRRMPGQRLGFIELIKCVGTNGKNRKWLVRCLGCGKEYVKNSISLKKSAQSCGCKKLKQNSQSPHWRGIGEISSSNFSHYKVNAKRRNIEFTVSHEYVWNLFLLQNRKCAISGLPIVFGKSGRDENTASLDRKDSKLPYTEGNVQWVHKHINMMKLDHPQDYFINLCSVISFNQNQI